MVQTIDIEGDINFLDVPNIERYRTAVKYQIYLQTNYNPMDSNITTLFSRSIIRLGTVRYNGKNLYFYAQAADYVPFKTGEAKDYVPREFLEKASLVGVRGLVVPSMHYRDYDYFVKADDFSLLVLTKFGKLEVSSELATKLAKLDGKKGNLDGDKHELSTD